MSDAGRPINLLPDRIASAIAEDDRLIGHDDNAPGAFGSTVEELRKVWLRNGDDVPFYAAGTWTPTLAAATTNPTVTYATRGGQFVRIGGLVTVGFVLQTSARSGGSGALRVGGLPYPVASVGGGSIAASAAETQNVQLVEGVGLPTGVVMVPVAGSSTAQIGTVFHAAATVAVLIGAWAAAGRLRATFSYFTAYDNPLE